MTRTTLLSLAAALAALPAGAQTMGAAQEAAGTARSAAGQPSPDAARQGAGASWDGTRGDGAVSPPPVLVPAVSPRAPSADLIVGTPGKHQIREPKNPLTEDGKPKEQKSGGAIWWGLGGAVVGAGVGFLVAGPIGAVIGGLGLALLAFFFKP